MKNFKTILLCLTIIYSLVMTTACPGGAKSLKTAFDTSAKVYDLGTSSVRAVGALYDSHVIPLALKDKIIDGLGKVAQNGRKFHNILLELKTQYDGRWGEVPKSKLVELDILFSSTVIEQLIQIIADFGILPPAVTQALMLAIGPVKSAILTIAQIFGIGSASYQFYNQEVTIDAGKTG